MNSGNQTALFSYSSNASTTANVEMARILTEIQVLELFFAISIFVTIHSLRQGRVRGLAVWPVVGMLPSLLLGLRKDIYEWITCMIDRQGGTFIFCGPWFTNLHCVITADPRNLEHMLKTKFSNYPKGEYFRDTLRDLLGDGIFNADDETWRGQRKTASLEFHSSAFRSMTVQSLLELVHSRLLPVLAEAHEHRKPFDLQDVLLRLTFDNVCMIAFGTDPGCLRPGLPEIPFAKAFENATEAATIRFLTPTSIWKAFRYLDFGIERCLRQSIYRVDEFAYEVIRRRKKELASGEPEKATRSDILTSFTKLSDETGNPYSDKFLRDICVNFILAGRDTSSVALAWFFWLLSQHQEVEDRILKELREIIAEREGEGEGEGELVFKPEEVKKMEYLHAALRESLRLYPSVPVDHKEVVEDDVFPDGTVVKKGTKVLYAVYAMGRLESIWGKDCRDYKPERWLRNGRLVSESAYKFPAFNGGLRLCLGRDFAYYQMKFVTASILHRYRVEVAADHPVEPKIALTLYMKHGLLVTLRRRDEA
ncbi:cytochrome P450 86B1-like isoform X1 [Musa acuminata AAA Group]|uniref:cytochrome P450 86B1-like isoform X1 n=1 Tax=Musa acuminata AAA Group TaxID=214697 RepID=UPI0031E11031